MARKLKTNTTKLADLLLQFTELHSSLNNNITRTDNSTHELSLMVPRLDNRIKTFQTNLNTNTANSDFNT